MSVLIVTEPDDTHAVLVKLALSEKQINCDLFFSADMPSKQENSILIDENYTQWTSNFLDRNSFDLASKKYTTVWWRRPRKPFIPKDIHPDDLKFVNIENQIFFQSLPQFLTEKIWWINPISASNDMKSKAYQLKLAKENGFKIPKTLITNSSKEIKQFIINANDNPVVYKSFSPCNWSKEQSFRALYTHKIDLNDLPEDIMLQMVPGIYQYYIGKKI